MRASVSWFRTSASLVLVGLVVAIPSVAIEPDDLPVRIGVASATQQVVSVDAWDPGAVQRLVRLDGALYQEDGDFYYRAIENRISVRLKSDVGGWTELVERAIAADPQTYGILEAIEVERSNRLGIVDLLLPDSSAPAWSELIYRSGLVEFAEVATRGVYTAVPNDSLYPQQWALNNTGQTGGTPGADIDAEAAWDISAGDPSIIVAVLDSGTLTTHPDLAPNVWINEDEIPSNGQDDDNNGFIDDVEGWDFGSGNNNVASSNFHGTHVTGIVNAAGGNGIGIAGIAGGIGGPGVRSMAVAVGEGGPISSIIDDSILYAIDNGAHVITFSLTVGSSAANNAALDEAYFQQDVFIDCAAGNNGSQVGYPANRPEVMAIASTTDDDNRSGFSNPGPELEVAAPGSNILSTQLGNSYGTSSGTSFAAPYVGGLAGLIRSVNPGLTAQEVRQLIIDTVDDVESPGFDNLTGWGRINAFNAVSQAGSSDGSISIDATAYACSATIEISASDFDLADTGQLAVTIRSDQEPAGEDVTLDESGFGLFSGAISVAPGAPINDGILQVAHQDTVTAEYLDLDTGGGGAPVLKTVTATMDCEGPQILGVNVTAIDDVSATINWTGDEPGRCVVRYGTDVPLDLQEISNELTTSCAVTLTNLDSCNLYKFEVEGIDALGNSTVDDNAGALYTFQTLGNVPGIGIGPCQLGLAQLDRSVYGCNGTVQVSLTDIDLDLDGGATDTAQVLMTSATETSGEWITLTESSPESGFFQGTIQLTGGASASDGELSVLAGDYVTVTYFDADDGQGQPHVATATSTTDCVGPAFQNVAVAAISATRAEITWTTNEPATSRVEYGDSAALGSIAEDLELKTSHNVPISAFEACERVFFRIAGADVNGDLRSADAGGQPFELNLNRIGGLAFHDNFETDLGWTLLGEWERGTLPGSGGSSGDPEFAYSGQFVLGTDLTGTGGFPGDYEPNVSSNAKPPSFSTTGMTDLELIFRRKLGLSSDAVADIFVGQFFVQSVWAESGVNDDDWIEFRVPIPQADDLPSVQIGFGLNATAGTSYGWNIDEMIVKESTQPDYLTCGGCAGAPSFGGLLSATDPAPCTPSGLLLEWQPAASWGTGSGGTYDVYRGTTPDFVPDGTNRVASGLNGFAWTDTNAPADTPLWYVVRARNDESCGGGEGLTDGNLTRLTAIETSSQPIPGGVGESLRVTSVGDAHVRLLWDPVPNTYEYVVRRSVSPDFSSPVQIGVSDGTLFEDLGVAPDGVTYFYRVFPVNSCGQESP